MISILAKPNSNDCYLAIEIGGTQLQLVVGLDSRILDRRRMVVDAAQGAEGIRTQIAGVLPELIAAIVGAKRGKLADIARQSIVIADTHYGRVEDVQMHILHMLCYAFMEVPELAQTQAN